MLTLPTLTRLTESLGNIAAGLNAPSIHIQQSANTSLAPGAVQDAGLIYNQMLSISNALGDEETIRFTQRQGFHMMYGVMNRFAQNNGIAMPAAPLPAAVTGESSSGSEETSNEDHTYIS